MSVIGKSHFRPSLKFSPVLATEAIQMLSPDRVYIWRVSLDPSAPSAAHLASWRAMLSAEELSKSQKFRSEKLRHDYIASHAALRTVLGRCLDISPASVQYANGPVSENKGELAKATTIKPALLLAKDSGNQPENLRFNLSHTRGAALIGVALGRELGVDIEWHRPLDDLQDMAKHVMSKPELEQWLSMPSVEQISGFYRVWTRKEAYLKAIGLGLYRNLHAVTVGASASLQESRSDEAFLVQDDCAAGSWTVRDIPASIGSSASVCCEGAGTFNLVVEDLDIFF
jgi:4'-phosphopantetheinyl transferase